MLLSKIGGKLSMGGVLFLIYIKIKRETVKIIFNINLIKYLIKLKLHERINLIKYLMKNIYLHNYLFNIFKFRYIIPNLRMFSLTGENNHSTDTDTSGDEKDIAKPVSKNTAKRNPKPKASAKKPAINTSFVSETNTNKVKSLTIKKEILTKKSAKKSKIKSKLTSILELVDKIREKQVPHFLSYTIKNSELSLMSIDSLQQKLCFEFFSKLNKQDLLIALLLIPKNNEELDFLKNIFLTKKFINILFSELNSENIEL